VLEARVYKLSTGFAWSEDPRSRTRHLITNVRIVETPSSDEVLAECNFVVYRTRLETDEDFWVGRRLDALRRTDGAWKIARREVYLDQTVLMSKNLSTFL
jgi:3-phenylpropionate/cinnamic acid dioxygenase small subunit